VERHPDFSEHKSLRVCARDRLGKRFPSRQTSFVRAGRSDMPILFSFCTYQAWSRLSKWTGFLYTVDWSTMSATHLQNALKMFREGSISGAFLFSGTVAAGFLFQEQEMIKAVFLSLGALLGASGAFFFFIRMLRVISPKVKSAFLPTLQ
jgi:hypothetical protein